MGLTRADRSPPRPTRARRRAPICLAWAIAATVLVAGCAAGLITAADTLLVVRGTLQLSDIIVVLGGDGTRRAARAVELYAEGVAPEVLITGDGDCLDIRRLMVEGGVPPAAIETECMSRNTWENAVLSAPILRGRHVERAVLVTTWFHSRRALGSFRAVLPEVDWSVAGTEREGPLWEFALGEEGPKLAKEFAKLAWYRVRHGIPLRAPADAGPAAGHRPRDAPERARGTPFGAVA